MSKANDLEILMLGLINAERAAAGVAPLTFDDNLNDASEDHSTWMLDADVFSHTGSGGSNPTQRMERSGYQFEGSWRSGENIGFQSERGDPGLEDDVEAIHQSLMNSPGHRANILNANFEEIGIGIERGDFSSGGRGFDSVMITQNFGTTDAFDLGVPAPDVPDTQGNQADVVGEMTTEYPQTPVEETDEVVVDEDEVVDVVENEDPVAEDTEDEPEDADEVVTDTDETVAAEEKDDTDNEPEDIVNAENPEDGDEAEAETEEEEETVDAADPDDSEDVAEEDTVDPVGEEDDMLVAFGCGQDDSVAEDADFSISVGGDIYFPNAGKFNFQFVFNIDLPDDDGMSDMVELEAQQNDDPFRGSITVEFDAGDFGDFLSDFTACQPDCMELA